MEPRKGRKAFVRNFFLSPLQGSVLPFDPTPGLRPGLFSFRPSGACLPAEQVSRQKLACDFRRKTTDTGNLRALITAIQTDSLPTLMNSPG